MYNGFHFRKMEKTVENTVESRSMSGKLKIEECWNRAGVTQSVQTNVSVIGEKGARQ